MRSIRFIHAADLHLDAPFLGVGREAPPFVMDELKEAGFTALRRLVELCVGERVDFLLLAGDVVNQEEKSPRASFRLLDAFRVLERHGVPVFMVGGNHDPFVSEARSVSFPDNVTLFGPEPSWREVKDPSGAVLAVVHGASHASAKETRNLAGTFRRTGAACPQIGLLHTWPGDAKNQDRYAPCTLEDLSVSGMDYWALGHIHDRRMLCQEPPAVYPGVTQGLHINETGDKGCLVVEATGEPGHFSFETTFAPLGPVVWDAPEVCLSADDTDLGELEARLLRVLSELSEQARPTCTLRLVRLRFTGRSPLDAELRKPAVKSELLERLRQLSFSGTPVWVKDLDVRTRPTQARGDILRQDDLVGELLRLNDQLREGGALEQEALDALSPLFSHVRARRVLTPPSPDELEELIAGAETLCQELLEKA